MKMETKKLHVKEIPPYKQTPADSRERKNQKIRTDALRREAEKQFKTPITRKNIRLIIKYCRCKGKSDAVNVIGGIADALNRIAYEDDKQITEIHYQEMRGDIDEYHASVEEA